MKCQRCGRCCSYLVIVVHPKAIQESLDLNSLTNDDMLALDGNKQCPHLSWDNDQAVCAIHHYDWFKYTPCGVYTQIEQSEDTPCRIGEWLRTNPDILIQLTGQGEPK